MNVLVISQEVLQIVLSYKNNTQKYIYTHKITILNYQWADSYHQGYSSLSNRIINHNHEYNHLYEFLPLKYKISELLQPKLTIDIINCISSYLK